MISERYDNHVQYQSHAKRGACSPATLSKCQRQLMSVDFNQSQYLIKIDLIWMDFQRSRTTKVLRFWWDFDKNPHFWTIQINMIAGSLWACRTQSLQTVLFPHFQGIRWQKLPTLNNNRSAVYEEKIDATQSSLVSTSH